LELEHGLLTGILGHEELGRLALVEIYEDHAVLRFSDGCFRALWGEDLRQFTIQLFMLAIASEDDLE
jgi:hypothetical protein